MFAMQPIETKLGHRNRFQQLVWLSIFCVSAVGVENVSAQSSQLEPVYWQHRLFYVPYKVSRPERLLDPVRKVQLLLSSDGVSNWQVLQEAEPNVQGFSYHAPADGEYWFALRHLDRRGQPWPSATVQPQMRVVVDTEKPTIALNCALDANGEIVARYEATDANLRIDSLLIELRPSGGSWTSLRVGAHDVAHEDRVLGRAHGSVPGSANSVEVRATISDQAGLQGKTTATVELRGPSLKMPEENNIASTTRDPFQRATPVPSANSASLNWPTQGSTEGERQTLDIPNSAHSFGAPPPTLNPYCSPQEQQGSGGVSAKTPARLVGDQIFDKPTSTTAASVPPITKTDDGWHSVGTEDVTNVRTVNSKTFDVEYDLSSVGPWGVSRVELWGTYDAGASWQRFGTDVDNRSPLRVNVPDSGSYGFRIVVHAAGGAATPPPQAGDNPELVVDVDLQAPTAELSSVAAQNGALAGHLQLRWRATDTNLERQPISLFYGSYPGGPWSPIATELPNTGSYTWRMERHVPGRFFVKLEVRDTAGNVAQAQTDEPFEISRPQPTGTLRGVRPVAADELFETANNSAR